MPFAIGAVIGAWVGRAMLFILASKLGTILVGAGLAITAFTGVSFIVTKVEQAIADAYSTSVLASYSGVQIGQLAWTAFKLAGGGDAVLMILAAYVSAASIVAGRVFLQRLTA